MGPAIDFMKDSFSATQKTTTPFTSMILEDIKEQVVSFSFVVGYKEGRSPSEISVLLLSLLAVLFKSQDGRR